MEKIEYIDREDVLNFETDAFNSFEMKVELTNYSSKDKIKKIHLLRSLYLDSVKEKVIQYIASQLYYKTNYKENCLKNAQMIYSNLSNLVCIEYEKESLEDLLCSIDRFFNIITSLK